MNQHRLIIDASSVLRASHYAGQDVENGIKVVHEGKPVLVNSAEWGYENFVVSYKNLLKLTGTQPFQTILVKDGKDSRRLRRLLYPEYKAHRKIGHPELNNQFYTLLEGVEDEILAMGGTVMVQDGYEADDVIAHLAEELHGTKTIWSRDADMLALMNKDVHVWLKDTMDPQIHESAPAEYVLLYKALVGDASDNLPGAKGFGKKAFQDLVLMIGLDGCNEFLKLLEERRLGELAEDVADFKPLQKVLDNQEAVYASYLCAKFYPHRINTSFEPLEIKTGKCEQWDSSIRHMSLREYFGTKTLITATNFAECFARVQSIIKPSPFVSLDLEAADTDEGAAWAKRIYDSKKGNKSPVVDVLGQRITGVSITYGPNLQHTFYCSVDHADTANCTLEQAKALIDSIPPDRICAVQNSNYELPVLNQHYEGYWLPNVWDTKDMASYVNENLKSGLKPSAKYYLGYDQTTYEEVTTIDGVQYRMSQLSAAHVFDYGCDDTICTAALFNRYLLTMELEHTLGAFEECELKTNYWVAEAFVNGVPCDLEYLKKIEQEDDAIYSEAERGLREFLFSVNWPGCYFEPFEELSPATIKDAYTRVTGDKLSCMARKFDKIAEAMAEAGQPDMADFVRNEDLDGLNTWLETMFIPNPEFDINKDDDLRKLMYDELELPVRFRTRVTDLQRQKGKREGTPQADFVAMEHAFKLDVEPGSEPERILRLVRTMNQVNTRRQLYYKPYPLYAHWKDGRIHASLGQNMTATRRFAPNGPNLNQLPKKGDGKKVRGAFRAPEGYVVVSADFSGQELRLSAEESQDEMLLSCYIGDNLRDPHSLTGAGIAEKHGYAYAEYGLFEQARKGDFGDEAKNIAGSFRDKGKGTNFSSQYLCRAQKLAKLLGVPVEEAQEFLDAKNAVYWGLAQWQQDTIAEAHAQGFVTTRMGARRHLHHKLTSQDKWEMMEAERQCVNFKIQGSGAEMTKRAVNSLAPLLPKYGAMFWFCVHDEVVIIAPSDSRLVPCIQALHSCMTQPYGGMTVPLESDVSIGKSFGTLKSVGTNPTEESINTVLLHLK